MYYKFRMSKKSSLNRPESEFTLCALPLIPDAIIYFASVYTLYNKSASGIRDT